MTKTVFRDGTIVTPDFLNKIFGDESQESGHYHDGRNEEGHTRKIHVQDETFGALAGGRIGPHIHWIESIQHEFVTSHVGPGVIEISTAYGGDFLRFKNLVMVNISPCGFNTSHDNSSVPFFQLCHQLEVFDDIYPPTDVFSPAYIKTASQNRLGYIHLQRYSNCRISLNIYPQGDVEIPIKATGSIHVPPFFYTVSNN